MTCCFWRVFGGGSAKFIFRGVPKWKRNGERCAEELQTQRARRTQRFAKEGRDEGFERGGRGGFAVGVAVR